MKYKLLLFFLPMFMTMSAQHFGEFQWKNRMVLIISESENSELVNQQLAILQAERDELTERKLVICLIHPEKYGIVNEEDTLWIKNSEFYNIFNPDNIAFKIELIGLDGGTKLSKKNNVLTSEELFSTIDSMPMRRRELKGN